MDADTARAIRRLQNEITTLRRRVVKLEELLEEFALQGGEKEQPA